MVGGSSSTKMVRTEPNPAAQLTDDLLVEILARVPYRSLCRFRCVSQRWRALISHPDNRRRLPQTLTGFFYCGPSAAAAAGAGGSQEPAPTGYCFADVAGASWPLTLSFLPDREREELMLVDSCNGLLLCRCYRFPDDEDEFDYLILNPATEKWVAVPVTRRWSNKLQTVRLGFDPALSPHFYVFEFQVDLDDDDYDAGDGHVLGVKIYSSATGAWSHKESGWSMEISFEPDLKSFFVDRVLYVVARDSVIGLVDVEGKTWRIIDFPRSKDSPFHDAGEGFIDLSQGRLHLANSDDMVGNKLAIWVLEDKDSEEWTLKHTVHYKCLIGRKEFDFEISDFVVVAIHPDRNTVFFVRGCYGKILMSYDMDSGKVSIIRNLGHTCDGHILPYVPLFSNSVPDGGNQ
ncbi:unnamed protein product [Urochloa humidicola]